MPKTAIPDSRKIEFAELIFQGKSAPQAGEILGITPSQAKDWLRGGLAKSHLEQLQSKLLAKVEKKAIFSRLEMVQEYLAIIRTPASETGNSKATQLNALNELRDTLGWKGKDFISDEVDEAPKGPKIYQPEWMRDAEETRPQ